MLAVDTNVLVRLLTGDDPAQSARARAIFDREEIFLPNTVLLETEWVLRSLYRLNPARISASFSQLIALPTLVCEDPDAIADAVLWMRQGFDFADILHIASSRRAGRFATFNAKLLKFGKRIAEVTLVS